MPDEFAATSPPPSLAIGPDGRVLAAFTQREIATLERLAEFFVEDERLASMKELLRLWQTLGGFGWFGRMLMIGVITLVSFIGAAAVVAHWFVGGPK